MIDNKYSKIYFSVIRNARERVIQGYTERHHVIPKSFGGGNDPTNLVDLTAKEHFVCHRLLVKMTIGHERTKMLKALWRMSSANKQMSRTLTSAQYAVAKRACTEAASLYRHSPESRRKISASLTGKKKSPEHRLALSRTKKEEEKLKISQHQKVKQRGAGNTRARRWILVSPYGETVNLHGNFKAWCKERGLPSGSPTLKIDGLPMLRGLWTGWTCLRL